MSYMFFYEKVLKSPLKIVSLHVNFEGNGIV